MSRFSLGVDVGGTFTDLVLVDDVRGDLRIAKVLSTPKDQSEGFMAGIAELAVPPAVLTTVVHGTTVGTNALLERKGARCGLITTRGFRDVLELGRRTRPYPYGMIGSFEALIARDLRMEVTERVDAAGRVAEPLDEDEVRAAVRRLLELEAEALVIHFLHAYLNPAHEERAYEVARELWPNPFVTVGSRILREVREFERGTTAAINGCIQPTVCRYVERVAGRLRDGRFPNELLVMQGNGGMMAASLVIDHAAHTVMSGPAAGVIAAAASCAQAGFANAISADMGGTSFDVALILNGAPAVSSEKDLAYGVPLRVPMVDIHTIGAGGGSIARIDRAGLPRIGPESAGSDPGPIAYGRGGTEPTITDANFLLGRLDPNAVPGSRGGGGAAADMERIATTMQERVGRHLGGDPVEAAAAILAVANNHMAGAIRLVSIEKGHDPRDFVLFAFGGAGPLHAVELARELGVPKVLVPRFPGTTSALGCVLADVRHDSVQTVNRPLADVAGDEIDALLRQQAQEGRGLLEREAVCLDGVDVVHEADLLYRGQSHVLRISVESPGFDPERVAAAFAERYRERFDIELGEMHLIFRNVRTTVIGRRRPIDLAWLAPSADGSARDALLGWRDVFFGGSWVKTGIYSRDALPLRAEIGGPAIVEQADTTVVIDPGAYAVVDGLGNLVVSIGG